MLNFYFIIKLKEIIDISFLGSVNFYDYMNFCLYCSKHGFYNNSVKKFKKNGVYDTLPNISKLFSFFLAIRIDLFLRTKIGFGILEIGPGSGQLSADILYFLIKFGTPFTKYLLLEYSDNLRLIQKKFFFNKNVLEKIFWVKSIPYGFSGILLANEILDSIPFFCLSYKDAIYYEKRVSYIGLQFIWILKKFSFFLEDVLLKNFFSKKKTISFFFLEIFFYYSYFMIILFRNIKIGIFYFFDYGYLFEKCSSSRGTLHCIYRKLNYSSPFIIPGSQDITAHVNFYFIFNFFFKMKVNLYPLLFFYKFFFNINLEFFSNSFDVYNKLQSLLSNELRLCIFPERMGVLFKILFFYKKY